MHSTKSFERLAPLSVQANEWLSEIEVPGTRQFAEAFQYAIETRGKRFRPVCTQLVAELFQLKQSDIRALCQAIELVHTSTLVHDDLPALDNDSLRRGRATVHVKYGEAVALLVGDALLGEAFRILGAAALPGELIAAFGSTYRSVCEGQVLDLDFSLNSWEDIKDRHEKKTGAMIQLALTAPAYLLKQDREKRVGELSEFGRELGLLFQLIDDVRDVTKSSEVLGKTSQLDQQLGRVTAVSFLGLEKAKQVIENTAENARAGLARSGLNELSILVDYLLARLDE